MFLSVLAFWFILYSSVRQKGLLAFMPPGLTRVMQEVSFFDILVDIIIYRKFSKMVQALLTPFFQASSPEEVKKILKEEAKISEKVYRGLFRKGIMNNFSPGMKAIMLPKKEPSIAKQIVELRR